MRRLALPVLCLALLGCAHQGEVPATESGEIQFPQFFVSSPLVVDADGGMFELDDALIRALQVASDDFLPQRPRGRPCAGGTTYKYRVQRRGDVIFVLIYEDPAACGQPYVALDSGARYAINIDGRILRRALYADSFEEAPNDTDGGIPVEPSQVGTSDTKPVRGDYWVEWQLDGGHTAAGERTLAFTTPELQVSVGSCAGPVGLETRDATGARAAVAKPVTVNLTATPPSAVFFADAKCTTALASADMAAGASGAEIYFRATQLGPLQIAASSPALSGSASQTLTVHSARAVAVAFTTPPQTVAKSTCSGAVTVQARDAFDNPATVTVATSVQLGATPGKSISFYARTDCAGSPITRADIPAGSDSATFYFKGRRPQAVTITAGLGTDGASQDESITSSPEAPRSGHTGK